MDLAGHSGAPDIPGHPRGPHAPRGPVMVVTVGPEPPAPGVSEVCVFEEKCRILFRILHRYTILYFLLAAISQPQSYKK